jgi:hypothetical protein
MDAITSLVKNTYTLLSVELNTTVDELFNYLLTGHDPETKFTKSRLDVLDLSLQLNARQIELHAKDEQLTSEQINELAARVTQQLTSILLSEGRNVVNWEGASTIAKHACLFVAGDKYNRETVLWLHDVVKYAVLLN